MVGQIHVQKDRKITCKNGNDEFWGMPLQFIFSQNSYKYSIESIFLIQKIVY